MNKELKELIKLSQFDKDIVEFEPKIDAEKEKLRVFSQVVNKLIKERDKLDVIINDTTNKRIKNDLHLKDTESKIKEIAKKHKLIKTERELKALEIEENILRDQVNFANEETIKLDKIIKSKSEELIELKKELEEEEKTLNELKIVIYEKIDTLEKSQDELYKNKSLLVNTVDSKILTFYEKIKRWAKEKAVVPVKNQACYGCYIKFSDRFYSEFKLADTIMNCPHCGRIIYQDETEEEII